MAMKWHPSLKTAAVIVLGSALFSCSGGSEERGRIRVTTSQVAGVYKSGSERIELQPNGTYIQEIDSNAQPLQHSGRWRIVNHFLDGSEVFLIDAAVISPSTPEDKNPHVELGDLPCMRISEVANLPRPEMKSQSGITSDNSKARIKSSGSSELMWQVSVCLLKL
jgi:hypothetical protein